MRFRSLFKWILAGLVLGIFIYGRYIEPDDIKITQVKIKTGFASPALSGKKIVHISDLHLSGSGQTEELILSFIEKINPDLIFLTGDYIQWKRDNAPALDFFSRLRARHGVFAVMGDYDYSDSRKSCLFCHEQGSGNPTTRHRVVMLRNSSRTIYIGGQALTIAGVDIKDDGGNLDETLSLAGQRNPVLVLSHSPLNFDRFPDESRIFMFSGDTHGGQIKVPKWLFGLFGYKKNLRYNQGLFTKGNKTLYVSSGIGTSHVRFRLFRPPEITTIEF